jgi:hypothetical protein
VLRQFFKECNVEELKTGIDSALGLLMQFGLAVAAVLTGLEAWLREELQRLGAPHDVQTLILLAVAALLVLGSLRLFGGLIRVAAVLVLVLIAIDLVVPAIQG